MIGLIFLKSNKQIIIRIDEVSTYTNTSVIGTNGSARGIDLSQADFVIVESSSQNVGDTLGSYVDKRSEVPPSPEEQIRQLQDTVASLQAQLGGE